MTDLTTELPTQEPYPFSTVLQLVPDGRHELLVAVVYQSDPPKCNGGGYRYQALFPNGKERFKIAKVYSTEIKSVIGLDTNGDLLCRGCPDSTRDRCFAQGVTPETCA